MRTLRAPYWDGKCDPGGGIGESMANRSKDKGDRAEREAVEWLSQHPVYSHLVDVHKATRMLAAGIPEDVGDIQVCSEVSIQVKHWDISRLGIAVRDAATGARLQAANGNRPLSVGMTKVPRARSGAVQWLASALPGDWLGREVQPVIEFGTISKALTWLRDDTGPLGYRPWPREQRICLLSTGQATAVLLAPFEAWLAGLQAYRQGVCLTEAA